MEAKPKWKTLIGMSNQEEANYWDDVTFRLGVQNSWIAAEDERGHRIKTVEMCYSLSARVTEFSTQPAGIAKGLRIQFIQQTSVQRFLEIAKERGWKIVRKPDMFLLKTEANPDVFDVWFDGTYVGWVRKHYGSYRDYSTFSLIIVPDGMEWIKYHGEEKIYSNQLAALNAMVKAYQHYLTRVKRGNRK